MARRYGNPPVIKTKQAMPTAAEAKAAAPGQTPELAGRNSEEADGVKVTIMTPVVGSLKV